MSGVMTNNYNDPATRMEALEENPTHWQSRFAAEVTNNFELGCFRHEPASTVPERLK